MEIENEIRFSVGTCNLRTVSLQTCTSSQRSQPHAPCIALPHRTPTRMVETPQIICCLLVCALAPIMARRMLVRASGAAGRWFIACVDSVSASRSAKSAVAVDGSNCSERMAAAATPRLAPMSAHA